MFAILAPVLAVIKPILKVLSYGITIPIGIIIAVGLWWHFDKQSSIREAADRMLTELVAGEELAAVEAKNQTLQKIVVELEGQAEGLTRANEIIAQKLNASELDLEKMDVKLKRLASVPVNPDCVIDDNILNVLRRQQAGEAGPSR